MPTTNPQPDGGAIPPPRLAERQWSMVREDYFSGAPAGILSARKKEDAAVLNRVMMIRPRLDELPSSELPDPYTIRWHREGDSRHWMAIKSASDTEHHAPSDFYERVYGANSDALARRQAFLCDGTGEPVGTVTAWWFENLGI